MGTARALAFRTAFFAETIQANLMPGRSMARLFPKLPCQGMINRQIKISHVPATLTDKVMMRQGDGLEPVKPASKVEPAHKPLFHKNSQVSIDGTQTEIWELLSHPVEQPLCRRVGPGLSKAFEYLIALSTLAGFSCHASHHRLANRNYYSLSTRPVALSIKCQGVAKWPQRPLLLLCPQF
jgi:hypothetical protein